MVNRNRHVDTQQRSHRGILMASVASSFVYTRRAELQHGTSGNRKGWKVRTREVHLGLLETVLKARPLACAGMRVLIKEREKINLLLSVRLLVCVRIWIWV
jgi:hypothetical protein